MKYFYHATSYENLISIYEKGILAQNAEGIVYMTEKPEEAARFVVIHGISKILCVKIKIPKSKENNIIETFDHSYNLFKCRAFAYVGNVTTDMLCDIKTWRVFDLSK